MINNTKLLQEIATVNSNGYNKLGFANSMFNVKILKETYHEKL